MLTATAVARAAAQEKEYLLHDSENLYLRVRPSGAKTWLLRWYSGGAAQSRTLGRYPAMTLHEARRRRDALLPRLKDGRTANDGQTFGELARDWYARRQAGLSGRHLQTVRQRLNAYILPALESRPVAEIRRPELIRLVTGMFDRGIEESAIRAAGIIENIFRYALDTGAVETSPAQYLAKALPRKTRLTRHFQSAADPAQIAAVMRGLARVESFQARSALLPIAYTFVRVGELLRATWAEIDLPAARWNIPAEHMKRRREHVVPLSRQALALMKDERDYDARAGYADPRDPLFPALRSRARPPRSITEAALLKTLKVLCWQCPGTPPMTVHGFRSMASSVLNGNGFNADAIELQLSHAPQGVRGVYNRAEYMDDRRAMMQWYADYLDALRDGK